MWPKDQLAEYRGTGQEAGPDRGSVGRTRLASITMPAAERYAAFARLATAHLCGVLGLTVGRIADLRLAVNEACGQFMQGPAPFVGLGGQVEPLELRFEQEPGALLITVRGPVSGEWPDRTGLGWLVMDALVADVRCEVGPTGGIGTIGFREPFTPEDPAGDVLWFAAS
jgi:anti-sigma regulatory factor (Ser/Thr protein kinase)